MAVCHRQRVSPRCDQIPPHPCGRARHRYLGSWILKVEKETGEVPGNTLSLEKPPRILSPGSNVEGRDPDFRRMEGGEWVNLLPCLCLTFTSVHGWMDGQKNGFIWVGWKGGSR